MILVRILLTDRNQEHRREVPAVPRKGDTVILDCEEYAVTDVSWDLDGPQEIIVQVR